MIPAIEQHIDFFADTIAYLDRNGLSSIEPRREAESEWCGHVNEVAEQTVYPKASTWYMGANVPGKPREFLAYAGGGPSYFERFRKVVENEYADFDLR
jgi:cyclohexanone monooxygenase